MKLPIRLLLLHPLFLTSVVLLILNDIYWKQAFPGTLTGKLSDLTGLIVLPVMMIVLLPITRRHAIRISALFFIWWKSPLSQPLIDLINSVEWFQIGRVVDYTDLIALLVLPIVYTMSVPRLQMRLPVERLTGFAAGAAAIFSLCSTSMVRYAQDGNNEVLDYNTRTSLSEEEVIARLTAKGLAVTRDTAYYSKMDKENIYVSVKDSAGNTMRVPAEDYSIELYRRSVPYSHTYSIPILILENDTLRNLRFSFYERPNGKQRIYFNSYLDPSREVTYYSSSSTKQSKKNIKKSLLRKFREMLE